MASGHLTSLPSLRASDEGRKRDTASPGARTRQLDPARTSEAGSAPLASPGLHQPTPLTPAPAPLQLHAPPGPSPWIWSMTPRSLRSTSRRFSRSCRPMRTRLRSSRRKSAEAFTSSTPRLAARGEGLLGVLASGEQGGSAAQPTRAPHCPPHPFLLLTAAGQGTADSHVTQALTAGGSSLSPRVGTGAGEGRAQTLCCERWEEAPPTHPGPRATYLPAGWPPQQASNRSTARSMSEAPGQWKQEQRFPWYRKLFLHISWGQGAGE